MLVRTATDKQAPGQVQTGLGQYELPTLEEFTARTKVWQESVQAHEDFEAFMSAKQSELRALVATPVPENEMPAIIQQAQALNEEVSRAYHTYLEAPGPAHNVDRVNTLKNYWDRAYNYLQGALGTKVEQPGESLLKKLEKSLAGAAVGGSLTLIAILVGLYLLSKRG